MRGYKGFSVAFCTIALTAVTSQFCVAQDVTVAFVSNRDGSNDIFVMDRMGNNLSNLTNTPNIEESYPSWSPDGTEIVFAAQARGEEPDVYIMNSDGSSRRNITNSPSSWEHSPSWSPRNNLIAFGSDHWGFRIMSSDGSVSMEVVTDLSATQFYSWSPDGTRIAFLAGEQRRLFIVNSDGTHLSEITPTIENSHAIGKPAISPDGSTIVFASHPSLPIVDCFSDSCGPFLDLISSSFYTVDTNGRNLVRLTQDPSFFKDDPTWLPDGHIIYTHYTGTNREIYVMDSDGTALVDLTNHPAEDHSPTAFVHVRTPVSENAWGAIKHSLR